MSTGLNFQRFNGFSSREVNLLSCSSLEIENPLKRWKFSPVDKEGQERWDSYTYYKEQMFNITHTSISPWIIIQSNNKKEARLESIRYVLSKFKYDGKGGSGTETLPDPNIVQRYHRMVKQID